MKHLFTFLVVISIISCGSSKKTPKNIQPQSINIVEGCPEKTDCQVEILENKKINFRHEEVTGKEFPEFVEDNSSSVVKITMDLNTDAKMVDGQYREEIIFEWPKNKSKLNLENEALQDVEFLYGRFCFCDKEQVGYFKISDGKLKIEKGKIDIQFENSKNIPQRVKQISGEYKLK